MPELCKPTLFCLAALVGVALCRPVCAVDLHRGLEEARKASAQPKPAVLVFGAEWCSWCRKYESATLSDPKFDEAGAGFLWVKVDIDRQPDLAAQYGASGVPLTVVLNEGGLPIGGQPGFMTVEELEAFLKETLLHPKPWVEPVDSLVKTIQEADSADALRSAVIAAVERLAKPERLVRKQLLEALSARGGETSFALMELLEDKRLSVRSAAAAVLAQVSGKSAPFNPFADEKKRKEQVEMWRAAISLPLPDGAQP